MTKVNDIKIIGNALEEADSIAIFPHVLVDGDAIGSAVALYDVLKSLGKDVTIVMEDKVPDNLEFICRGKITSIDTIDIDKPKDVHICIDCSTENRFPLREGYFFKGDIKLCIDHHLSGEDICDYSYILSEAPATGVIIYDLIKEMNWEISHDVANALYVAIATDTGNFQFANTTKRCHEIVADLYDLGLEANKVNVALYENEPIVKIKLQAEAMELAEVFCEGKAIIGYISQEMLKKHNARMGDGEGLSGLLRTIKGVQIAAVAKEEEDGKINFSLRAKDEGNVAFIAEKHDGGGHVKAAGCTFKDTSLKEAIEIIKKDIEEELETK